ncbi:MAG: hypothetical protein M1436_00490 [Acidobacteria bacterium]|nr:hypothetical protein [Acidobacteriota bacterium]
MQKLFAQFVQERAFLKNVTRKTERWYTNTFSALHRYYRPAFTLDNISHDGLKQWVINMRQHGVLPVSCNTYIKGANAFLRWMHEEGHLPIRYTVPCLRAERKVIETFTPEQVRRFIRCKPDRQVFRECPVVRRN